MAAFGDKKDERLTRGCDGATCNVGGALVRAVQARMPVSTAILLGLGASSRGLAARVIPAAVSHRLPPAVFANYSPKYLSATWMPSLYIF